MHSSFFPFLLSEQALKSAVGLTLRWHSLFHDDDDDDDDSERERQQEHVFKRKSLFEAKTKTTIISSLFSNAP